jgi:hypothetical protein
MRGLLVIGGAACSVAGCGDNDPPCGHVQLMSANRNIWGGHIALDDERIYFSDYENGARTRLIFRQPRDGGQELVIAARDTFSRFGFGMAVDATYLYWAAESPLIGFTLFATPRLGGATLELSGISPCTGSGIAVDRFNAYAGAVRCSDGSRDFASSVIAVPHDGSGVFEVWSSTSADVSAIAALDGTIWIATSGGLYRVSNTGTVLLDGRPSYHVVIAGGQLFYSTDEAVKVRPLTDGTAQTLYAFTTSIEQPRAFAVDGTDIYISEPPSLRLIAGDAEPVILVGDMGAAVTHVVAGNGSAYWATLAAPGSLGLFNSFSGGVFRVRRPCN